MNRLVLASGTVLAFAFIVATQGCSSSDSGTGGTGNTGNTSAAGTGNTSSGGTTATAGASAGGTTAVAGTSAGGTTATAGASAGGTTAVAGTSAGGTSAAGTSAGGTSAAGTSSGGTSAGGTDAGGMPATACDSSVKKGGACTTSCAKACGVKGPGATKAETCTGGVYVEGPCTYPTGADLSCYKKPATPMVCDGAHANATDASQMVVTANTACTVADCMPCGPYEDSSGAAKVGGLCVCTGATGMAKWNCASATEWPVVP